MTTQPKMSIEITTTNKLHETKKKKRLQSKNKT